MALQVQITAGPVDLFLQHQTGSNVAGKLFVQNPKIKLSMKATKNKSTNVLSHTSPQCAPNVINDLFVIRFGDIYTEQKKHALLILSAFLDSAF